LAKTVHNYLDRLDDLVLSVRDDSDFILNELNLDAAIKSPQKEMERVALMFLSKHLETIKKAGVEGERFADRVLAKS